MDRPDRAPARAERAPEPPQAPALREAAQRDDGGFGLGIFEEPTRPARAATPPARSSPPPRPPPPPPPVETPRAADPFAGFGEGI